MKIAAAQINPVIADVEGNREKIISFIRKAENAGADLVVFPEMAVVGYPPMDLLESEKLIDDNLESIEKIASVSNIPVICGFVSRDEKNPPMLKNSAAFIKDGKICSIRSKTLLPTYDVFDELRYFSPAESNTPVELDGKKLGITICEDIWKMEAAGDERLMEKRGYPRDPVDELVSQGAEIIINISASPFVKRKHKARITMIGATARSYSIPVVYVNQTGGNDSLIFDGNSFAVNRSGSLTAHALSFEEDMMLVDAASDETCEYKYESDIEEVRRALVLGLKDYVRKCGFTEVLIGMSGGIDSALTAAIAVEALSPEKVTGVTMPSPFSSKGSVDDSIAIAENTGMKIHTADISSLYENFIETLAPFFKGMDEDVTEENLQARIRGTLLMALSNKFGSLLLTTGNKSEIATGYCTLYGDMCGGLAVLSDLPKTMVYELSEHINRDREIIPRSTIDKPPSAELKENQTDQDSLPPYDVLDEILEMFIEKRMSSSDIISKGYDEETVTDILRKINLNEYKRLQAAPGLKVTSKAFGSGRRIPVANRFRS